MRKFLPLVFCLVAAAAFGQPVLELPGAAKPGRVLHKLAKPFNLEEGAVKVTLKTVPPRRAEKDGLWLVNGFAGAVDHHQNRSSRLWFNVDGFSKWSPSADTIFFTLYDREGNKPGHFMQTMVKANFENNRSYEFGVSWSLRDKFMEVTIDGAAAKQAFATFPDKWAGAAPLETLALGGDNLLVEGFVLYDQAVSFKQEE